MVKVTFKNDGSSNEAQEGTKLQQTIKTAGWPVAFACEDGVCGTCLVHVEKGAEHLSEMGEREKQTLEMMGMNDGEHRLACQCSVVEKDGEEGEIVIEGM